MASQTFPTYHDWVEERAWPLLVGVAMLAIPNVPAYHYILQLLPDAPADDTLTVRCLYAGFALLCLLGAWQVKALRRISSLLQTAHILFLYVLMHWIVLVNDNHPMYLASSYIAFFGAQIGIVRLREWSFVVAVSLLSHIVLSWYFGAFSKPGGLFPTLAYVTVYSIASVFLILKVLAQRREYEALASLHARSENLAREREKSDALLLNILPASIASRIKQGESMIADRFEEVTVLFCDLAGFTVLSTQRSPEEIVRMLGEVFSSFDRIADRYKLEKIKTIGDAYMLVGGLPEKRADHAEAIAEAALAFREAVRQTARSMNLDLEVRIGFHTGPAVAGVIGTRKFVYDLWGDTVNVASRMESHSAPGQIQCTEASYEKLQDLFLFESRGEILVKGKGMMKTFFLQGRTSQH
jgi:class 3 adenylate cyclase